MKNIWKFVIFCFVGGSSALIDLIVFNIAYTFFGLFFIGSRIVATMIAVVYNFTMNRNFTFGAKKQSIKKQTLRYSVVYSISIGTNWLVSFFVLGLLGESVLNANIASVAGIAVSIPIGFFGSLLWAFKKDPAIVS